MSLDTSSDIDTLFTYICIASLLAFVLSLDASMFQSLSVLGIFCCLESHPAVGIVVFYDFFQFLRSCTVQPGMAKRFPAADVDKDGEGFATRRQLWEDHLGMALGVMMPAHQEMQHGTCQQI